MMSDCIFCKIVDGKIPCSKIAENEKAIAFLDISPLNKGHSLVVPKKHFKDIYEIDETDLKAVFALAKKVSIALKKAVSADGINLYQCNESASGQVVFHFHLHVIPRFENDGLGFRWHTKQFSESETKEFFEKIKKEFS